MNPGFLLFVGLIGIARLLFRLAREARKTGTTCHHDGEASRGGSG